MTDQDKNKALKYLANGIDYRVIIMDMARATKDEQFINKCHELIKLQSYADRKKDLEMKILQTLEKIDILDSHLKQGLLDEDYIMQFANDYFKTVKRIEKELIK